MKKILLLLLMTMCVLSGSAKSLVLTLKNGEKVYFLLSTGKNPVMKFENGGITVENKGSYTFPEIASFVISATDDPNAIEDVKNNTSFTYRANTVVFAGDVNSVKVYNAAGAQVEANISGANGSVAVDLNDMANGTYVISAGNKSFKVIKK